jgi:hypothetical protein
VQASVNAEQALAGAVQSMTGRTTAVPVGDLDVEAVVDWLARLRLLDGVPFEYLVPDAELLAPETIRFFHLDRTWTDAAVDGALAAGAYGTRDRAALQASHAAIRDEVDDAERRQWGTTPRTGATAQITGFVLRSRAVSGWPGLTVRAFRRVGTNDTPLQALRIERLSPSVLVVLLDDQPTRVEIEEPRQGIQFGVVSGTDRTWSLPVRNESTGATTADTVGVPFRRGSAGVLHLTELRSRLAHEIEMSISDVHSGRMAYHLLRLPYRQIFGPVPGGGIVLGDLFDVTIGSDRVLSWNEP